MKAYLSEKTNLKISKVWNKNCWSQTIDWHKQGWFYGTVWENHAVPSKSTGENLHCCDLDENWFRRHKNTNLKISVNKYKTRSQTIDWHFHGLFYCTVWYKFSRCSPKAQVKKTGWSPWEKHRWKLTLLNWMKTGSVGIRTAIWRYRQIQKPDTNNHLAFSRLVLLHRVMHVLSTPSKSTGEILHWTEWKLIST